MQERAGGGCFALWQKCMRWIKVDRAAPPVKSYGRPKANRE
jgi:hypothetical protein